jgi:hypothetical protein
MKHQFIEWSCEETLPGLKRETLSLPSQSSTCLRADGDDEPAAKETPAALILKVKGHCSI